jgi:Tfp pilus assembly protein PilO
MKRRRITIAAIAAAIVVMAGGGGVYAYNQQVKEEQQKLEERRQEEERLKQEEQKRLEEEKRLKEAREAIQKELEDLEMQVAALYADEQKKMLAEGITQDGIDAASAKLETMKEKYKENPDISLEQTKKLEDLEEDLQDISKMQKILAAYNAFYPNGQLAVPGVEIKDALENVKGLIKELQDKKPDFCKIYEEKVGETESQLAFQESVIEAINMIYSRETGAMIPGVTRQQYTDVLAAVESLPENTLKAELRQYLIVVDQTLTAQEEAAKAAQSERKLNTSSNVSAAGNSSGSSKKGSSSSGNSGNNSAGTGGSSKGSSGSGSNSGGNSGGASSSGGSSGGSGSSGSSGGSSSSGSGGSSGNGHWESTTEGGGDIKGGGTYEWGYVQGDDFPPAYE